MLNLGAIAAPLAIYLYDSKVKIEVQIEGRTVLARPIRACECWPVLVFCRGAGGQAPGLPVAQRVEHAGEQLAGRSDLGDVACLGAAAS